MTKLLLLSIILLFQVNIDVKSVSSQDKGISPTPQIVNNASVLHPQETIFNKIDGKVYLQVLVDTLGYVEDARIDSSDHDVLGQLAIDRVHGIRFSQSYIDKTHVTSWLPMVVTFDVISDSTKRTNYTIKIKRPPGESVVLNKNPALIKVVFPNYPQEALKNNLEGRVVVEVLIDQNGNAKEAFAVETDNVIFNESALEAVGRFQFTPGMFNGQPVPAWVGIPIPYTLSKKDQ